MRPAINDSLISGQPLYLLYSKRNLLVAVPASMARFFPTQATGRVRLHVTGNPPTTSGSSPGLLSLDEQPASAQGRAEAKADCRSCRRLSVAFKGFSRFFRSREIGPEPSRAPNSFRL